jgi:hypothetical protein
LEERALAYIVVPFRQTTLDALRLFKSQLRKCRNAMSPIFSKLFCADFKPGLRNLRAEAHKKSAVKLRDF